jgi:hypothetical protein
LGYNCVTSAVIVSAILEFDKKALRNVVIGAFILGCIRGYTGKNIIEIITEV